MIHNISQPVFEDLIADQLLKDGVVEIRKNNSYISCEQVGKPNMQAFLRL